MNFSYGCFNTRRHLRQRRQFHGVQDTTEHVPLPVGYPAELERQSGQLRQTYSAPGNSYFASLGSTLEYRRQPDRRARPTACSSTAGRASASATSPTASSNTIAFGEWRIGTGNLNTVTIRADIVWMSSFPRGVTRGNGDA